MSDEITEGESRKFRMEGGDIIRADGTCAGYTALDFQSWFRRLEALAGLAGEALKLRGYTKHRRGCSYLRGNDCNCGLHDIVNPLTDPAPADARAANTEGEGT